MEKIRELWKEYKEHIGPAFVLFEAAMHVYLVIYLSVNWTNLLIWGFTVFELTMFIYLLKNRRNKGGIQQA